MPLLPMSPPDGSLGLPPPGLAAGPMLPPPDVPPAGAGALALAPLAEQQQAELAALKAQQAQQAMAVAMQAMQAAPSPAAEAAQVEPVPMQGGTTTPPDDQSMQGGY